MKRCKLLLAAGSALSLLAANEAGAQYFAPAAPRPVVVAAPAFAYSVAMPAVVQSPPSIVASTPAPVVAYYQPPALAPAPVVTYYRAPVVSYAPSAQVVTRFRPILGGAVTRVRPTLVPVVQ